MKKLTTVVAGFLVIASINSCNEDSLNEAPESSPVKVQFTDDEQIIENAGSSIIKIDFDKKAFKEGTILVKVSSEFQNDFQTIPETTDGHIRLIVMKDSESIEFTFIPADNELLNEEKSVNFEISHVSEGFAPGQKINKEVVITDNEIAARVNFSESTAALLETEMNGAEVIITLSSPASESGQVLIQIDNNPDQSRFSTEPPIQNSTISLPVAFGDTDLRFRVVPLNDTKYNGEQIISFRIAESTGSVVNGNSLLFQLTIKDDELIGKAKSYETRTGNWRYSKSYEYDEHGRIIQVNWEKETPAFSSGTEIYHYAENGLIQSITFSERQEALYLQQNGKIYRSEQYFNGQMKSYTEYDYDSEGNVSGSALYNLQSTGEYQLSLIFLYLYFLDGNIYKQLTYIPVEGPEEYVLISTRSYDNYLQNVNPFPMIEIIPGLVAQKHLPITFHIEEQNYNLLYNMTYQYTEDGLPSSRTTGSGSSVETTFYKYY